MDLNKFTEVIKTELPELLEDYEVDTIKVVNVRKNNGVVYKGLSVILKDEKVAPNIYIDHYYSLYKKGYSIQEVKEMIAEEFIRVTDKMVEQHYANINICNRDNIFIKLINLERNRELLKDTPYVQLEDLAIVFNSLISVTNIGILSAVIHDREFEMLGLTKEELYDLALSNTKRLFPHSIRGLHDVMQGETGLVKRHKEQDDFYVLTNNRAISGAGCILYKDVLYNFAKKLNRDIYILPSSIHEVLLLPVEDRFDLDHLLETVRDANQYAVREEEYLSDNVYIFERSTKTIKGCMQNINYNIEI